MLPDDDYASLVPNPPTIFGLTELRDAYIDAVADEENPRPMAEERRAYFDGLCGLFDFDLPTSRKAVGWNRARYVHGLVLNAAKSLLRTGSPWDGYLEAGALLEALDDLGIGQAHRSMVVDLRTTVEASRSKHRALLDLLLTGLLGERAQLVFTLADLDAAGIERAVPIRYLPD
ncbi:hypothetical protein ATM97_29205 [Nocardia sp. MH4]|uniref:Uncharacterized protein n=1 Tax=Nocardia fluminea TaxID=134984 RepID=A0A2N3VD65_9NOCA|nr:MULTISPECIES: hypothetical protein [Nocardia]MBW0275356.1 hypothetical protein [Nocardia sp. MH4]PKV79570.1 hypothetical protein ATK86_3966 [Nocardia fluminea]